MPRRDDIRRIMIVGSGPIVIGQACEFDYSGTQACKVLRREGYEVSLVNSNPATIMTDPQFADRTYIEPLDPASVLAVLERERPDALLPTLGGQTGLNVAVALAESGDLDRLGVRLIGASLEAIHRAEDRSAFKQTMLEAGLEVPRADVAHTLDQALSLGDAIGYPVIVRAVVHARGRWQRLRPLAGGARRPGRGAAWRSLRWARSWSRSRSPAGRSSSWRSCATATTTASSCARSRTSTRWACTPATRSRWRP